MDTISIFSKNSKNIDPGDIVGLSGKINLKRSNKFVALSNLSIYNTQREIKSSNKINKFKISAPTLNDKFELSARSYLISDLQDFFEYSIKKHKTLII